MVVSVGTHLDLNTTAARERWIGYGRARMGESM